MLIGRTEAAAAAAGTVPDVADVAPPAAPTGASGAVIAGGGAKAVTPSRRALVTQAALIWLAARIAYIVFTYFAVLFSSGSRKFTLQAAPPHDLLAAWLHWDAHWYLRIAQLGYFSPQPTAFFPLYPLLIHLLTAVVGPNHELAAAMAIANVGTLGAFIAVSLLAAHELGERAASLTLRLLIAYPLAFFLFAPYTEGMFIGFVAGALYCARRGSWRWAALWALLAALTRPTGLALILPLAWEYGRQHDWWRTLRARDGSWRRLFTPRALVETALAVGAVPAGVAAYALYCWRLFGTPLIFLHAEKDFWGHVRMPPWQAYGLALANFAQTPAWTDKQASLLITLVPVTVLAVVTLVAARRMPVALTLYSLGVLYLCLASPIVGAPDVLSSDGRYVLTAIPLFLLLARWSERRPWLETLLVSGGLLVQGILALVYLRNGLVA